jgi:hypothetical protein
MPKKPGGQPDNLNAYKHGFYSRHFTPFESRVLSKIPLTDLSGEIGLLRVNVDRFMQSYAASLDELDYASRLAGLRAITLAVGRIAMLQRILAIASRDLAGTAADIRRLLEDSDAPASQESSPGAIQDTVPDQQISGELKEPSHENLTPKN